MVCDKVFHFVLKKRYSVQGTELGSWNIREATTAFNRMLSENLLFSANITINTIPVISTDYNHFILIIERYNMKVL